ncbi:MAG: hypothetical protein CMJ83_15840, partial [Planctomycetes bacterium]|nr:hypothetical protein [Planctomycetota bacterium]
MRPRSLLSSLFLILFLALYLPAQEDPVAFKVTAPAQVTSGETLLVKVEVSIDPPYHIYGLEGLETGVPTEFSVGGAGQRLSIADGAVKPARAADLHDDEAGKYTYWEGAISFEVPVKVTGPAGLLTFTLAMDFMACTDMGCLPPGQLEEALKVEVVGDSPVGGGGAAPAKSDYPVRVQSSSAGAVTKGRFDAVVTLQIDDPYHIYGLDEEEVPSTTFQAQEEYGRVGLTGAVSPSRPAQTHQAVLEVDQTYRFWEGDVTFTVPLGIEDAEAGQTLDVVLLVTVMACEATGCLDEKTFEVPLEITVPAGGAGNGMEGVEDPDENDEPEAVTVVMTAAFLGDTEPGREVTVEVPLPEGVSSDGATVKMDAVLIGSDQIEVTGDGVVKAVGDGLVLRFPAEVKDTLLDKAELDLTGTIAFESGSVDFALSGVVNQPITAFILLAMGAALLALLTPCVFPMIPITISFFTKQAESSPVNPMVMGFIYCAGIIISFVAIGVIFTAALGPTGAVSFAQSPITLGTIAVLFIVFALSLFG